VISRAVGEARSRPAPRNSSSALAGADSSPRAATPILSRPRGFVQHARARAIALGACAALLACSDRASSAEDADFDAQLRARIEAVLAAPAGSALGERLAERALLRELYAGREGRPAWLEGRGIRAELARDLLSAVGRSQEHGLIPAAYHQQALARALDGKADPTPDRLANLDVLLSDALLHLAHHLVRGAVDPRTLQPGFARAEEPALDVARVVAAALEAGAIAEALAQSAPQHAGYRSLTRALARLREAQAAGGEAAAGRIDQLRANLERWRWLPRDLGARHLLVNVAAFRVEAFDGGTLRLAQRAVVGEQDSKTPLVSGSITHLVLNPDWRVPKSIATNEMLPAARRNPNYFREHDLQVLEGETADDLREVDSRKINWRRVDAESFPYHLRQPPGPHNPLGRIKFSFENPFGVYLHGTPGDRAFARGLRALSHGCVRVEDEIGLAEFALATDPAWTHDRLLGTLVGASDYALPLAQPLPVHLVYFTASAQPDGAAEFGKDPYGWDRVVLAALDPRQARSSPHFTELAEPRNATDSPGLPVRAGGLHLSAVRP
jgi:murein L,D-transpeptidase YcbB/YkuD